jgi:hypothetical protein
MVHVLCIEHNASETNYIYGNSCLDLWFTETNIDSAIWHPSVKVYFLCYV